MPTAGQYPPLTAYDLSVTIAQGQTASTVADLHGASLVGVFVPTAMTGTAFSLAVGSAPAGPFLPVKDSNGTTRQWTVPTSGGCYSDIDHAVSAGWRFVQLVSSASEAQARTFQLSVRPI